MQKKLLTVVIPAYNMEKLLAKCISSVLVPDDEFLARLEILVINDGSKDKTSEIAHKYESRHIGVIRVIDKRNGNYGSCINVGIRNASGIYIKILDADDCFDTECFNRLLKKLAKHESHADRVDAIITPYVRVDIFDRILAKHNYDLPENVRFDCACLLKRVGTVELPQLTYRTQLLREISYCQTEGISYTDTEWFFLPLAAAKSIKYWNIAVYRYLIGRQGQTVAREATIKGFSMYLKVLDAMGLSYSRVLGDSKYCREYLEFALLRLIKIIAGAAVAYLPVKMSVNALQEVNRLVVVRCPQLQGRVHSIWLSSIFKFRYLRFANEHHKMVVPYVCLLKLYLAVAKSLKRGRKFE